MAPIEDFEKVEKNFPTLLGFAGLKQRLEVLYDRSPDLLSVINTDGIIVDCNRTYANHLGYSKNELIGTSIFETISVDSPNSARESFETWKKDGKIRNKEVWLKRKDGSFLPALISANNFYDENGNLIGNNTTIRDISEIYRKKKNQKELELEFDQTKSLNLKLTNDLLKIFYELETQNDNLKASN